MGSRASRLVVTEENRFGTRNCALGRNEILHLSVIRLFETFNASSFSHGSCVPHFVCLLITKRAKNVNSLTTVGVKSARKAKAKRSGKSLESRASFQLTLFAQTTALSTQKSIKSHQLIMEKGSRRLPAPKVVDLLTFCHEPFPKHHRITCGINGASRDS
jgi:hypothetical protein